MKTFDWISEQIKRRKSFILYLFFGGTSTLVNIGVYCLLARVFGLAAVISTSLAWIITIAYVYVTNRRLVFGSAARGAKEIIREIWRFFLCRVATGLIDLAIMYVCVDVLGWNDVVIKALANVVVIILNYVASKVLIFKK